VGFGGIPQVLNDQLAEWSTRGVVAADLGPAQAGGGLGKAVGAAVPDLKELLTEDEWRSARASVLNAHYTSHEVIANMWSLAERLGFQGGRVLEAGAGGGPLYRPGAGTPQGKEPVDRRGAGLAHGAYPFAALPQQDVRVEAFEDARIPDHSLDLVIGNFPFANTKPYDNRYKDEGFNLHNYFFAKSGIS
jgi:hypothetical protein